MAAKKKAATRPGGPVPTNAERRANGGRRLEVWLPEELDAALRDRAATSGEPLSAHVVAALRAYLNLA